MMGRVKHLTVSGEGFMWSAAWYAYKNRCFALVVIMSRNSALNTDLGISTGEGFVSDLSALVAYAPFSKSLLQNAGPVLERTSCLRTQGSF